MGGNRAQNEIVGNGFRGAHSHAQNPEGNHQPEVPSGRPGVSNKGEGGRVAQQAECIPGPGRIRRTDGNNREPDTMVRMRPGSRYMPAVMGLEACCSTGMDAGYEVQEPRLRENTQQVDRDGTGEHRVCEEPHIEHRHGSPSWRRTNSPPATSATASRSVRGADIP